MQENHKQKPTNKKNEQSIHKHRKEKTKKNPTEEINQRLKR